MTQGIVESYRVRCSEGCHSPRIVVGRDAAERGGLRHNEETGHVVHVEAVSGGETHRIGD